MAKTRRRFLCLDCGIDTGKIGEHYMLRDTVWFSVVGSNQGMLCVGCIEGRLCRRLNAEDFNNSYVNGLGFGQIKSNRLLERLRTWAENEVSISANAAKPIQRGSLGEARVADANEFARSATTLHLLNAFANINDWLLSTRAASA